MLPLHHRELLFSVAKSSRPAAKCQEVASGFALPASGCVGSGCIVSVRSTPAVGSPETTRARPLSRPPPVGRPIVSCFSGRAPGGRAPLARRGQALRGCRSKSSEPRGSSRLRRASTSTPPPAAIALQAPRLRQPGARAAVERPAPLRSFAQEPPQHRRLARGSPAYRRLQACRSRRSGSSTTSANASRSVNASDTESEARR